MQLGCDVSDLTQVVTDLNRLGILAIALVVVISIITLVQTIIVEVPPMVIDGLMIVTIIVLVHQATIIVLLMFVAFAVDS